MCAVEIIFKLIIQLIKSGLAKAITYVHNKKLYYIFNEENRLKIMLMIIILCMQVYCDYYISFLQLAKE